MKEPGEHSDNLPIQPERRPLDRLWGFVDTTLPSIKLVTQLLRIAIIARSLGLVQEGVQQKEAGDAIFGAAVLGIVATASYMQHLRLTNPRINDEAYQRFLENPYREFVQEGTLQVARDFTEDYLTNEDGANQLNLADDELEYFHLCFAAELLNRQHLLPEVTDGLDPEKILEMLQFNNRAEENMIQRLAFEDMPRIHGLAELEMQQRAEEKAAELENKGMRGKWTTRNIAYAAKELAEACGSGLVVRLLREFFPYAAQQAIEADHVTGRIFSRRELLLNTLEQHINRIIEEDSGEDEQLQEKVHEAMNRISFRLGGFN